ncbi:MAG: transporter substrate-binding domain-containing protein [Desulfococcaceae bacterium]
MVNRHAAWKLAAVVLVFVLTFAGIGFAGETQRKLVQESTIEQVLKRGVLRVGMSTFVPWAMRDKNGELIGFEIDVAKKLAEDMGVEVEFVPTKWAGIIPALLTGKFDVIIGGMGIVPKRNLKVNFSVPYDYSGMSMVANKEVAPDYDDIEDFNKPEATIVARLGSTAADAAKRFMPKAQHRFFDDEAQAYQELLNGKAHAVVGSAPTPAFQALKYPDKLYLPLDDTFTKEPIGFAMKKGDVDTLNFFDSWIRIQHAKGFLKERKAYWFEGRDWESRVQ